MLSRKVHCKNMILGLIVDARMGGLERQNQACRLVRVAKCEVSVFLEKSSKMRCKRIPKIFKFELWALRGRIFEFLGDIIIIGDLMFDDSCRGAILPHPQGPLLRSHICCRRRLNTNINVHTKAVHFVNIPYFLKMGVTNNIQIWFTSAKVGLVTWSSEDGLTNK